MVPEVAETDFQMSSLGQDLSAGEFQWKAS